MRSRSNFWPNLVGNLLAATGAALVLFVLGSVAYRQWQEHRPARALAFAPTKSIFATPTPRPTFTPTVTDIPGLAVSASGTPEPGQPPAELPSPGQADVPDETPLPSEPVSPTATPIATPAMPRPRPTPTPAATALSPSPPARLFISALDLDAPVVEMGWQVVQTADGARSEWLVPDNAAGHHSNSADLGENGNIVISGHNNIRGKVFKSISLAYDPQQPDKLVGYRIQVFAADGRSFTYAISVVHFFPEKGATLQQRQEHARVMSPTSDPTLTIITCWPYTSNTHRIVIQARSVATADEGAINAQ